MNQNFRLPSLQLDTSFDTPITPLEVPGTLGRKTAASLCLLDGAIHAPQRLTRLVQPVGLMGVKLADAGDGVRISLRLLVDDLSTTMWDRRRFRLLGEPMPDDEEYVPYDVSGHHRLVEVTAQGRPRGLAVLALRRHDDGQVVQTVSFELGADEIGGSGLVMVGLEHPAQAPSWSRANELEDSLVGVCVARMKVDPIAERVAAHVSTGRPARERTAVASANPGFFVVNPATGDGATAVSITPRGDDGARLRGRRAKAKHPLRFAQERIRDSRLDLSAPAVVDVVDRTGATLLEAEVPAARDGKHEFEVPAAAGPVFVRARSLVDDTPRPANWAVRVRPAKDR